MLKPNEHNDFYGESMKASQKGREQDLEGRPAAKSGKLTEEERKRGAYLLETYNMRVQSCKNSGKAPKRKCALHVNKMHTFTLAS